MCSLTKGYHFLKASSWMKNKKKQPNQSLPSEMNPHSQLCSSSYLKSPHFNYNIITNLITIVSTINVYKAFFFNPKFLFERFPVEINALEPRTSPACAHFTFTFDFVIHFCFLTLRSLFLSRHSQFPESRYSVCEEEGCGRSRFLSPADTEQPF